MKKLIILILFLVICNVVNADPIDKVRLEPYEGGVSFNTISFMSGGYTGWVTASSVRGRKRLLILNTSTTGNIYVTGNSGSSVTGTIYPRERAIFGLGSEVNIYVSSDSVTAVDVEVWEIL